MTTYRAHTVGQHVMHPVGSCTPANLVLNPNLELATPQTTVIRTNLCTNPNFEVSSAGWSGTAAGYTNSTIATSSTRSYLGTQSLQVTWPTTTAAHSAALYTATGLTIGVTYTFSAFVYVPAGNPAVNIGEIFLRFGTATNLTDTWQKLSVIFTATATTHFFGFWPVTAPTAGQVCYVDAVLLEQGNGAGVYFDGSTTITSIDTCAWTGTANLSTSTLSRPNIALWTISSGVTFTQTATNKYVGNVGGRLERIGAVDSGISQQFTNLTTQQSQVYTFSFWMKVPKDCYPYITDGSPYRGIHVYGQTGTFGPDGVTPLYTNNPVGEIFIINPPVYDEFFLVQTTFGIFADVQVLNMNINLVQHSVVQDPPDPDPVNPPANHTWNRQLDIRNNFAMFPGVQRDERPFNGVYIDGIMLEPASTASPYFDGDYSGYAWTTTTGSSITVKSEFSSALHTFQHPSHGISMNNGMTITTDGSPALPIPPHETPVPFLD